MYDNKIVLVTGPGRSCSNWVLEIVRLTNKYRFMHVEDPNTGHVYVEDRAFLKQKEHKIEDMDYCIKCCTENDFTLEDLKYQMDRYPNMKVIFTMRHPIDLCMSKIVRGQPKSMGGDNTTEETATDGTMSGAIESLKVADKCLSMLADNYEDRLMIVRLEDLLCATVYETIRIAQFVGPVMPDEKMIQAYKYNRNKYQSDRYNGEKDMSVINLHQNLDTAFDGFFKRNDSIDITHEDLEELVESWNYTPHQVYYQVIVNKNIVDL